MGSPLFPKVRLTQKLLNPEQAVLTWPGPFNLPMEMWREACCRGYFRTNQTDPIYCMLGEHWECTTIQRHLSFTVFTYHAQFCKWGPQWIIHIYPDQCSVHSTVKPNMMERRIRAFNLHLSLCTDQQLKAWYLFCSYWPSLKGLNISSNIFCHIRSNTLFSCGRFKLIFEINCLSLLLTLLSNMNLYRTGYLHWPNKGNGMTVAVSKWFASIALLMW